MTRSIWDYAGINLSDTKKKIMVHILARYICVKIIETGATITIPEASRYQSMFVCGGSEQEKHLLYTNH